MNTKALQKCVEELKTDKPRIDYVVGILETLIDTAFSVSGSPTSTYSPPLAPTISSVPIIRTESISDEETNETLDKYLGGVPTTKRIS